MSDPRVRFLPAAIAAANDSRYGLAADVFSADLRTAWRTAEELEHKTVYLGL